MANQMRICLSLQKHTQHGVDIAMLHIYAPIPICVEKCHLKFPQIVCQEIGQPIAGFN